MANQRSRGRDVRGVVLLDKPLGLSSNQALQRTKRLFQAAKAGHSGSLDPLATGMLPICFGAATRLCGYLLDSRKTYSVVAQLGVATSTGDAEGEIIGQNSSIFPEEAQVLDALAAFAGEHEQVPPMYSALKKDGVPLYRLARRGIEVPRAPRPITIYAIRLSAYSYPEVRFTVTCSKGTYVRTLVTDLAAALDTLGHVTGLRRLSVDPYAEHQLKTWEQLEDCLRSGGLEALDRELLPADGAIEAWPRIDLDPAAAARLLHGQKLVADRAWPQGQVRVYGGPTEFLAIGEVTEDGELVPRKVFLP